MDLFMGVDIGTSGVRAAIFDEKGKEVGLHHEEYPMICTEPGMGELDPDRVFKSTVNVIKSCIEKSGIEGKNIAAIGFSTQLFSILAVDSEGKCLTNVFTWADSRSVNHAELIKEKYDYVKMYNSTGCRAQHPMYPVSKILWFKDTKSEIFAKTYKFISIKEYVLFRLYGKYVIDITDASTTGYFNIHNFTWDKYIIEDVLEISENILGEPVDCTYILKGMKKEYAEEVGINPETPVVIGSGDGMLANVGCGVFDNTSMSSTIGTSGALRIATPKPILDPLQRTWCYCFTKDTWVAGGAINNGGIVLKWLRDQHKSAYEMEAREAGLKNVYQLFDLYANEINPGSDGLIFLPFLTGERSPNWNASTKGTIHGLQLIHSGKHLVRAAMEAVIYRMFSVYEILTAFSDNVKQVIANGGYTNSEIWLQIQADVFNREIAVAGINEASAFGAAYVAMAAIGAIGSLKHPLPAMKPQKSIKPISENSEKYKKAYKDFKKLYSIIYS
ncbi:MAG: gluconokinase [Clostridiaceae bacterium]|jgi:gluconokinase|nr:gluconokinase [Clostridiaceae bacterium]